MKMGIVKFLKLVLIAVVLCCASYAQTKVQFSVTVTDEEGARIGQAEVSFHWDPSGSETGLRDNIGMREDGAVKADKLGVVKVELPPGFYDVFISSPAFTPQAIKIRLKKAPAAKTVKLKVDPLVSAEIADRITEDN